ncbi:MAG: pilus assembly protein TadG-related protein [Planctomycetota bacterium]
MSEARSTKRCDEQSGTVLVLFALILVGVFGLLGVVVDGGRLRIAKQQLDAGAESAALEGLRFKDRGGDAARRRRALAAVARQWDDDLDASNGDAIGLGAGSLPIVQNATPLGGDIVVAAARAWKPAASLQQNVGNAAHGDMVAGVHLDGGAPIENDTFQRQDFAPTAAGSAPATLAAAPAFLVRLRRATQRLALDRQFGVSSAGPSLEWLWARGSAWQEPGAGEAGQGRSAGMTIRAASIASTERALIVSADPVAGTTLASFALRVDAASSWNATAVGAALVLDVGATGALTVAGAEQGVALAGPAARVGDAILAAPSALTAVAAASELLVAVYAPIGGQRRIVGFTLATAALTGTPPGASVTVTRLPAAVLPAGASSVSPAALDARLALELTPGLAALHATFAGPVLAPVLRR